MNLKAWKISLVEPTEEINYDVDEVWYLLRKVPGLQIKIWLIYLLKNLIDLTAEGTTDNLPQVHFLFWISWFFRILGSWILKQI